MALNRLEVVVRVKAMLDKIARTENKTGKVKLFCEMYQLIAEHARVFFWSSRFIKATKSKGDEICTDLQGSPEHAHSVDVIVSCLRLIDRNLNQLATKMQHKWRNRDVTSFDFMMFQANVNQYTKIMLARVEKHQDKTHAICDSFVKKLTSCFSVRCVKQVKTQIFNTNRYFFWNVFQPSLKKHQILLRIRQKTAAMCIQRAWRRHNTLWTYVQWFDVDVLESAEFGLAPHMLKIAHSKVCKSLFVLLAGQGQHLQHLIQTSMLEYSDILSDDNQHDSYIQKIDNLLSFLEKSLPIFEQKRQNSIVKIQRWWSNLYYRPPLNGTPGGPGFQKAKCEFEALSGLM